MVRFAVPVSVRVTSCAVEVPTVTLPKFTFVELVVRTPAVGLLFPPPEEPPVLGEPTVPQPAAPSIAAAAIAAVRSRIHEENLLPPRFKVVNS
jgi:hypothetical protein